MSNPNPWSINENEFVLVEEVEATMSPNHDRLLIRKVEGIDPMYLNLAAQDLRERTSTNNQPGVTCNWVLDPKTGSPERNNERIFKGVWRGVSVRPELRAGRGSITQVLAYGLIRTAADSWPAAELVTTDDRLIYPHAIQDSPYLNRKEVRYRGFDPSYVESAKNLLTFTGDNVQVRSVRMQDGSYNIHLLTEAVTWAAFDVSAPDLSYKGNDDTEHEVLTEEWNSIVNNDTLTGLYTDAVATYRINDVVLTENLDGSIKVVRRSVYCKAFDDEVPDLTWYDNKDTESEILHELWQSIDIDDPLTDLYTPTSGYNVARVDKTDNHNGTISVHRQQWLQGYSANDSGVNDARAAGTYIINPHSSNPGKLVRTITTYNNYLLRPTTPTWTTLPDASDRVKWESKQNGNGYWDAELTYEVVTWSNTTPTYETIESLEANGFGYREKELATGVPIANAEGIVDAAVSADSNKAILEIGWQDAGNGEAHVTKIVDKQTEVEAEIEEASDMWAGIAYPALMKKAWLHVAPNNVAARWVTAQAYKYSESGGWAHKASVRNIKPDGYADIIAVAWIPPETGVSGTIWADQTGLVRHEIMRRPTEYTQDEEWAFYSEMYEVKYHFYEEGAAYTEITAGLKGSEVTPVAPNVWRSLKVTKAKITGWYAGPVNTETHPPPAAW